MSLIQLAVLTRPANDAGASTAAQSGRTKGNAATRYLRLGKLKGVVYFCVAKVRRNDMTILVTGATGFLGSALTTELVKQKQDVRILARDKQKARAQFGEAVTIIHGEITDVEQVK